MIGHVGSWTGHVRRHVQICLQSLAAERSELRFRLSEFSCGCKGVVLLHLTCSTL
jgi:hypothetical protein